MKQGKNGGPAESVDTCSQVHFLIDGQIFNERFRFSSSIRPVTYSRDRRYKIMTGQHKG